MAPHSSTLAWKIPWTGEPGRLQSMGSQRVRHDWATFTFTFVPCPVQTIASWPAYRLLRRQIRWCGIPITLRIFQVIVIHTVKDFGIVNKAEVDVFPELSCFFDDPMDVGNFSGSSAFSKSRLNIWKLSVHVLLKPGLENFEHHFASVWDECNCVIVWTLSLPFFGTGMKTDLFQSCGHCWVRVHAYV